MNALDEYADRARNWERETSDLARLGYRSVELDLRDYWGARDGSLSSLLNGVDLVWVLGGNAFVLGRAMTKAGFGDALREAPDVIYAGYSAGACVASIDLDGIEAMDDPTTLPAGYTSDMKIETLRLVRTRVIPHAGAPEARKSVARLRSMGLAYLELADGEDAIFD
jgi:dipeptidase E